MKELLFNNSDSKVLWSHHSDNKVGQPKLLALSKCPSPLQSAG
jgi:hypothetical protein